MINAPSAGTTDDEHFVRQGVHDRAKIAARKRDPPEHEAQKHNNDQLPDNIESETCPQSAIPTGLLCCHMLGNDRDEPPKLRGSAAE